MDSSTLFERSDANTQLNFAHLTQNASHRALSSQREDSRHQTSSTREHCDISRELLKKHGNFTVKTVETSMDRCHRTLSMFHDDSVHQRDTEMDIPTPKPKPPAIVPYEIDDSSTESTKSHENLIHPSKFHLPSENLSLHSLISSHFDSLCAENTAKYSINTSIVSPIKVNAAPPLHESMLESVSESSYVADVKEVATPPYEFPLNPTRDQTDMTDTVTHDRPATSSKNKDHSFPLFPDFSDFSRNSEMSLFDYNNTKSDKNIVKTHKRTHSPPTPILEKTFDKEFLSQMWPQRVGLSDTLQPRLEDSQNKLTSPFSTITTSSLTQNLCIDRVTDTSSTSLDITISSSEETSSDCIQDENTIKSTERLSLKRNLTVLKRTKIDRDKLHEIGEKVSSDFKRKCIITDAPIAKKPKIKKIEWTEPGFTPAPMNRPQDDLRGVITDRLKRINLTTDNSQHFKPKTLNSNFDNRPQLTARRYIRKCRLCDQEIKNLKTHLALAHLKPWWGVLGDQTCWICQQYHGPIDIAHCSGAFVPLFHREIFIDRHIDFMAYLTEDFGVTCPKEILQKITDLKLHDRSVSNFSEREEYFLQEIDRHYRVTPKEKHNSLFPTYISEIFHWKTLTEILLYLRTHGNISGRGRNIDHVTIIDTNCDIISLFKSNFYEGFLAFFPPLSREKLPHELSGVITHITDPRTDITTIRHIMNDPDIKVSLGVDMGMTGYHGREYLNFCANNIRNHNIVAVGGLGLSGRHGSSILNSQIQILENFCFMAKQTLKPVRIFSTNMNELTYKIVRNCLGPDHPVHLLDFTGGPTEAKRFYSTFKHGFIGLSCGACDPSPALLHTIRELPLDRFVLESNAPYQAISYRTLSKPTDILVIADTIARIKNLNTKLIIKRARENTSRLYKF